MLKIFKKDGVLHDVVYNIRTRSGTKDEAMVLYYVFYKLTHKNLYGGVVNEIDLFITAACAFSQAVVVEHHARDI
jgi:hypothetical protein